MKNFNLKKILYLYFFISIFFYSKFSTKGDNMDGNSIETREDCSDEECFKITIDINGTINKYCIKNENNKTNIKTSIFVNNTFIIFDCMKKDDEESKKCQYKNNSLENHSSISDEPSPSNCIKKKLLMIIIMIVVILQKETNIMVLIFRVLK